MDMQETNSLPSPQVEGDDRAQARALAILHSHPVVSLVDLKFNLSSCLTF